MRLSISPSLTLIIPVILDAVRYMADATGVLDKFISAGTDLDVCLWDQGMCLTFYNQYTNTVDRNMELDHLNKTFYDKCRVVKSYDDTIVIQPCRSDHHPSFYQYECLRKGFKPYNITCEDLLAQGYCQRLSPNITIPRSHMIPPHPSSTPTPPQGCVPDDGQSNTSSNTVNYHWESVSLASALGVVTVAFIISCSYNVVTCVRNHRSRQKQVSSSSTSGPAAATPPQVDVGNPIVTTAAGNMNQDNQQSAAVDRVAIVIENTNEHMNGGSEFHIAGETENNGIKVNVDGNADVNGDDNAAEDDNGNDNAVPGPNVLDDVEISLNGSTIPLDQASLEITDENQAELPSAGPQRQGNDNGAATFQAATAISHTEDQPVGGLPSRPEALDADENSGEQGITDTAATTEAHPDPSVRFSRLYAKDDENEHRVVEQNSGNENIPLVPADLELGQSELSITPSENLPNVMAVRFTTRDESGPIESTSSSLVIPLLGRQTSSQETHDSASDLDNTDEATPLCDTISQLSRRRSRRQSESSQVTDDEKSERIVEVTKIEVEVE